MVLGGTCADAVCLVSQRAEVAIHAVGAQSPPVPQVALARPVALSAAIPTAVAVPAAGPLRPALALCGDTHCAQSTPQEVVGGALSQRKHHFTQRTHNLSSFSGLLLKSKPCFTLKGADTQGSPEPVSLGRAPGQPHSRHGTKMLTHGGGIAWHSDNIPLWPHIPGKSRQEASVAREGV